MKLELSKVMGHRGACAYAPENTLASMVKAHQLGAKWVEFDVMLARCGEPIIIHDWTLDRTTNGVGEVAATDYKTIAMLDAGSWFSAQYTQERIPTLREVLQQINLLNLSSNIEIKPLPGKEEALIEKALPVIKNYCQLPSAKLLVSSFSRKILELLHAKQPQLALGYLIDDWHSDWELTVDAFACASLHVEHTMLTKERVRKIKGKGLYVLAYTVNDIKRAKELFNWGIDSVFTDMPDQILAIVED